VGAEIMESLLFFRGFRVEIGSTGIVGYAEVNFFGLDFSVCPADIGDRFNESALFGHFG
jgi:hypothetical protein